MGRTSATKATNQTIAIVQTTVGGEEGPLHHRDVQVDVRDDVEGEHGERADGGCGGGDGEGDARPVGRPPGEADEAVREGGEDADPRGHAHQHLRQVHAPSVRPALGLAVPARVRQTGARLRPSL